ncbi:MAG: Crp/Fnr family transcriptional regulator [Chitinophagaceae bacterium]
MRNESCNVSSCFLCSHCTPEWRDLIAVKKTTLRFKKGEQLFKEGEKVTGIYLLYSGAVKVHKHWTDQKELILRFTKAGNMLGHRGLATGDVYPVSATALEDSTACFITSSFLETTLKADHAFTYRLMQLYAAELQKAEMRMRNLALMDVNGRIAEALLELLTVYGTNKSKYISVTVTRQDIAAYAGTTYETVFKMLRTLIASKTISVTGKSIRINNIDKLKGIIMA